jgi:cobalamin biosynthetic protein CobC
VSGAALAIGSRALADAAWREKTRGLLAAGAARLDGLIAKAGLELIGGTSLFRLVRTRAAPQLFQRLGEAGILVRRFADYPAWLRFGLPDGEAAWQRLAAALPAKV